METTAGRLRAKLESILNRLSELIAEVEIERFYRESGEMILVGVPDYNFGAPPPASRAKQLEIKRAYDKFADLVRVLLGAAPEELLEEWRVADEDVRTWVELGRNYGLRVDRAHNERVLRADGAAVAKVLAVLESIGDGGVMLVPDTSSIMDRPDPTAYRGIAGADRFTFVLLPTVLVELDDHKGGDSERRRELAKKVIARISGWRDQARRTGSALGDGVTVDKTITVRAEHEEPDVESSLRWLDPDVSDDRIVASVLSIEAQHPAARVVLVTGDVNLQNKADAALIEVADTPP
jgi:hypothetical protein